MTAKELVALPGSLIRLPTAGQLEQQDALLPDSVSLSYYAHWLIGGYLLGDGGARLRQWQIYNKLEPARYISHQQLHV